MHKYVPFPILYFLFQILTILFYIKNGLVGLGIRIDDMRLVRKTKYALDNSWYNRCLAIGYLLAFVVAATARIDRTWSTLGKINSMSH